MAAKQKHFSPKQIANALAVSESSVKRWCDQDKIPVFLTCGGHRRVTLDSLYAFLNSTNRSLSNPEVLGLPPLCINREMNIPAADQPGVEQIAAQKFQDALVSGQEADCRAIAKEQRKRGTKAFVIAQSLLTGAMQAMGEGWRCQKIDPYQERRACEICLRIIRELMDDLGPAPPNAPIAIGAAPSSDPYQLPTAMVELTLRELGWNATSLGNDLPLDCLFQAVHDCKPRLVWLSVSSVKRPSEFIAAQTRFAEALPDDVILLLGGRALTDTIRPKLSYTSYCDGLSHLAELAGAFAPPTA